MTDSAHIILPVYTPQSIMGTIPVKTVNLLESVNLKDHSVLLSCDYNLQLEVDDWSHPVSVMSPCSRISGEQLLLNEEKK